MASADPAFLPLGTEVSAKYRGAFCEAKVKKIVKALKIKVQYADGSSRVVTHEDVVGMLRAGCVVQVQNESGDIPATIIKITDSSVYTVVFDDGDENTLRRTQLCLKSEKHFMKYETLDDLPLTHPEHFGTPVLKGKGKKRRAAVSPHSSTFSRSDSESDESDEPAPRQYPGRLVDMIGKVLLMTQEDRKKTLTVPVLIVQPNADTTELKTRDHLLVKSFKDSKFYAVTKKETKEFTREAALKNDDKTLKAVYEKALLYFDAKELPPHWDKDGLFGSDSEDDDDDDVSSDEEQSEEKDMFVAQLYKFMDERGTPINKAPLIGSRDLNLYRLFRVVSKLGGYNRVTNQMKWRLVYSKMGLPNSVTAANQVKSAYKRFLHAFEDFYRKLGSTMGTNIARPSRIRHSSGRTIPGFRDRDRPESVSPKSPRSLVGTTKKEPKKEVKEETTSVSTDDKKDAVKSASPDKTGRKLAAEPPETEILSPSKRKTRGGIEEKPPVKTPTSLVKEPKRQPVKTAESDSMSEGKDDSKRKKLMKKKVLKQEDEDEKGDETETESHKSETDSNSGQKANSAAASKARNECPPGSKVRLKYGKGKTTYVYEAKVLDFKWDGGPVWHVHYNGWNTRYDEWVRKDRVVEVVQVPETKSSDVTATPKDTKKPAVASAAKQTPPASSVQLKSTPNSASKTTAQVSLADTPAQAKQTTPAQANRPASLPVKAPAVAKQSGTGQGAKSPGASQNKAGAKTPVAPSAAKNTVPVRTPSGRTPGSQAKTFTPTVTPKPRVPFVRKKIQTKLTPKPQSRARSPKAKKSAKKAPRPTRSTSVESSLSLGLSPRKRLRRNSGVTEASDRDESSDSEESDDEIMESEGQSSPYDPVKTTKEEKGATLPDEVNDKEYDIVKALHSSMDMDFDKASQDSLERELNLNDVQMPSLSKSKSGEDLDLVSMLSCLDKDDYKVQSSENESVVSETDRRTGRGRSKAKSEIGIRSKQETLTAKLKADPGRNKSDTESAPSKTKAVPVKAAADIAKSKPEPPKTKAELKSRVDVPESKPDVPIAKEETLNPPQTKAKLGSPKAKADAPKTEKESPNPKLLSPQSGIGSPKTELVTPKSSNIDSLAKISPISSPKSGLDQKIKVELERVIPEVVNLTNDTDPEEISDSSKLTKGIKLESFDLPTEDVASEATKQETKLPDSKTEAKNEEALKCLNESTKEIAQEQSDKSQSESSTDEQSAKEKNVKTETGKKILKAKGRGKRKIEKEEALDSEEEPPKKVTRRKGKKDIESPEKSTNPSNDESSPVADKSMDEIDSTDVPDMDAKPIDSINSNKACDFAAGSRPALSPRGTEDEEHSESSSQDNLSTFDLRGAVVSPVKAPTSNLATTLANISTIQRSPAKPSQSIQLHSDNKPTQKPSISSIVEDTPPSTPPEFVEPEPERSQSKLPDVPSEAASTKSELEANMEVERYLQGALPPGGQSPDVDNESNASSLSEESVPVLKCSKLETAVQPPRSPTPPPVKKKAEEPTAPLSTGRKRKRKAGTKHKHDSKPAVLSDEDDGPSHSRAALHEPSKRGGCKYNFIQQLEEGKNLEGEERVNFLLTKIADLRSIYMQLKQEVASIDRRRKRQRKKQRLAAQGLIGLESAIN